MTQNPVVLLHANRVFGLLLRNDFRCRIPLISKFFAFAYNPKKYPVGILLWFPKETKLLTVEVPHVVRHHRNPENPCGVSGGDC